jgi:hypothetical protein
MATLALQHAKTDMPEKMQEAMRGERDAEEFAGFRWALEEHS